MKLLKTKPQPLTPALRTALEWVERAQAGLAEPRDALTFVAAAFQDLPGPGEVVAATWAGDLYPPDDPGGRTVVPLVTTAAAPGAPDVALELDARHREMLGALLLEIDAEDQKRQRDGAACVSCGCSEDQPCSAPDRCLWVPGAGAPLCSACLCATPGCGDDADLDASDPALCGWVRVEVAGAASGPVWVCSATCAAAAIAARGQEIVDDDRADDDTDAPAGLEPAAVPAEPATVALAGVLDAVVLTGWDLREDAEPDTTGVRWVHLTGWALTAVPEEGDYHLVDAVLPGRDPLHGIDVELAGEKPSDDFDSQFVQLRWPAEARSGGGR